MEGWKLAHLIDTHAHLDAEQLGSDLPDVLRRAQEAGVVQIVAVGITAASSANCVALAGSHAGLFATVGIHPNEAASASPGDWGEVLRLVRHAARGWGRRDGLDRHWDKTPFPLQEEYFARHLELARQSALAVVIHCREAEPDILKMLREVYDRHGAIRGVLHSFTGTRATAEAALAMGLHISFAGMLTYKNAGDLREVAATIPLDRLLVETDSPYLAPVPLRGKRNEPANVVHTAACLAGLHASSPEEMAERTTRNARALFGITQDG